MHLKDIKNLLHSVDDYVEGKPIVPLCGYCGTKFIVTGDIIMEEYSKIDRSRSELEYLIDKKKQKAPIKLRNDIVSDIKIDNRDMRCFHCGQDNFNNCTTIKMFHIVIVVFR